LHGSVFFLYWHISKYNKYNRLSVPVTYTPSIFYPTSILSYLYAGASTSSKSTEIRQPFHAVIPRSKTKPKSMQGVYTSVRFAPVFHQRHTIDAMSPTPLRHMNRAENAIQPLQYSQNIRPVSQKERGPNLKHKNKKFN